MFSKIKTSSADEKHAQGIKLLEEKKFDGALLAFNASLASQPNHSNSRIGKCKALVALGKIAREEKKWDVAENRFKEAHELNSEENEIHAILATVRRNQFLAKKAEAKSSATSATPAAKRILDLENLVFQGGGVKGLAYLGALQELLNHIDWQHIQRLGGASAGAITAVLLAVGYTLEELQVILKETKFTEFMDGNFRDSLLALSGRTEEIKELGQGIAADVGRVRNITSSPFQATKGKVGLAKASFNPDLKMLKSGFRLMSNQKDIGLFPGEFVRKWIEGLIQAKTGIPYATFADLQRLAKEKPEEFGHFKAIYLVGANISLQQTEVFSHETTPDHIVSDAMRLSMSIPLVFTPHTRYEKRDGKRVKVSTHQYVDGGLLDNYPLWLFDKACYIRGSTLASNTPTRNPLTLGLCLVNKEQKLRHEENSTPSAKENAESLASYVWQIMDTVRNKQHSDHRKWQEQSRTIYIDHNDVLTTQFDLSDELQQSLIKNGKDAVSHYMGTRFRYDTGDAKGEIKTAQLDSEVCGETKQTKKTGLEDQFEKAVRTNDIKTVQLLLLREQAADKPLTDNQSALDLALSQGYSAMILTLALGGFSKCKQPILIYEILLGALQSDFIDRVSLQMILAQFKVTHNLEEDKAIKSQETTSSASAVFFKPG